MEYTLGMEHPLGMMSWGNYFKYTSHDFRLPRSRNRVTQYRNEPALHLCNI